MSHPRDWYVDIAGQGPDLVLLHGLGASSFSWRHNRAQLARHFRVITPDLPGHGRSPAPLNADYRAEAPATVLDWSAWGVSWTGTVSKPSPWAATPWVAA